jgi:hypothetical protein
MRSHDSLCEALGHDDLCPVSVDEIAEAVASRELPKKKSAEHMRMMRDARGIARKPNGTFHPGETGRRIPRNLRLAKDHFDKTIGVEAVVDRMAILAGLRPNPEGFTIRDSTQARVLIQLAKTFIGEARKTIDHKGKVEVQHTVAPAAPAPVIDVSKLSDEELELHARLDAIEAAKKATLALEAPAPEAKPIDAIDVDFTEASDGTEEEA